MKFVKNDFTNYFGLCSINYFVCKIFDIRKMFIKLKSFF